MRSLSDAALDNLYRFATWAAAILTVIAAVCAVLALFLDRERTARKALADARIETARQSEIAAARKQAEEATRRALELEEKAKPRSLSPEQRTQLLTLLKVGPKGPVFVLPKTFDEEAENYAMQITDILKDSSFVIKPWTRQRPMSFGVDGAFMWVKNFSQLPPHGGFIQKCFKKVCIILDRYENAEIVPDANDVIIGIGKKP